MEEWIHVQFIFDLAARTSVDDGSVLVDHRAGRLHQQRGIKRGLLLLAHRVVIWTLGLRRPRQASVAGREVDQRVLEGDGGGDTNVAQPHPHLGLAEWCAREEAIVWGKSKCQGRK